MNAQEWVEEYWHEDAGMCEECAFYTKWEEKHGLPGPGEICTECLALVDGTPKKCPAWQEQL